MKNTLQKSSEERSLPFENRGEIVSWFSALKHSWRAALRIDRSQITTVQAIRSTIGFVLPLALGVATGHVLEGVSLAGGAASLGTVGLTYTYRARIRTMLLACLGIALSAFVGSVTGRIDWLAILVAGVWGIGAGMLVAISLPAMVIGLQSVVALIILSHFELDPFHAAIQAALMFAGALLQVMLIVIPWPWRRHAPERIALSTVYQKLADYAIDPSNEQNGPQVRDALMKAHTTLSASNSESHQGKIFFGLLEEAEHIRLSLIILNRARQNLAEDTSVLASSTKYLDQIIQSTANELRMIANALSPAHPSRSFSSHYQQMKEALTALRRQEGAFHDEETKQHILAYCDALRDQLHRARKLAKSWKHRHQRIAVHLRIPRQTPLRIYNAWAILRANLTLRSATFRHAIRLGITLALATALYRLIPLPIQRGYWIPLTALLVLKPDFTATFARGVARTLGTMLGAVLTTLLVSVFSPGQELLVILDAIAAYLAFSILYANYAIFSVFLTMETVFLLTFVTPQPLMTAADRAIDTAIGGVLALLMYVVWPTWELPRVWGNIANRLDAARHYFAAVMEAYAHPEMYDHLTIHNCRMNARLARSNAEASVQRSLQEPEPHRIDSDLAYGLLGAIDTLVQSVLTLEAYLIDNQLRHALPEIAPFTAKVDEALSLLTTAVREKRPVTLPDLKEALRTLESSEKSANRGQSEVRTDLRFVLSESKRIIRSINTMQQLLSTKLATKGEFERES